MEKRKNSIMMLAGLVSVLFLTFLDQITKQIAAEKLADKPFILIDGVFEFRYIRNYGSAWGMLSGKTYFLIVVTLLVMALIIYAFVKTPKNKKYALLTACEIVLFAGALGNFIDRILFGYVRDFLYFSLIDFPIFNIADCYVVVSAVIGCILVLFVYRDDDFAFLSLKRKEFHEKSDF